jgi:hypothetical protein
MRWLLESCGSEISGLGFDVYVFDIDSFSTQAQVKSFFHGFPTVTQTPAVGVFRNGSLEMFASGNELRTMGLNGPRFT